MHRENPLTPYLALSLSYGLMQSKHIESEKLALKFKGYERTRTRILHVICT